jgi:hypothetical protein
LATAKKCKVEGCKRPYRAKGYCVTHYSKWRRGEIAKEPGKHSGVRFRWCFHEECKKREYMRGLCEEHYNAKFGNKKKTAEAVPEAPAAQ